MNKNTWIAIGGIILFIGIIIGTFIQSNIVANALLLTSVCCFAYAYVKDRKKKNHPTKKEE